MIMAVQTQVRRTVAKYSLLSPGDGVVVGVSGGPDSIALLHLLSGMSKELALRLEVAHVMHGIRGEEAKEDARFVAESARTLGLGFHLKEVDIPKEKARRGRGNIEAIGREERYDFFSAVMRKTNCNKVATGHTRDDQVETMLMWMFRGGGRGSLGGIPPSRSLTRAEDGKSHTVIRPLIEISKKDIIGYLKKERLSYRRDRTNFDPGYLRNWLRLRLLPQLRRRTDYRLDLRLARLCDLLWEEDKLLDEFARARLRAVAGREALDAASFMREERAMRRRLLRLWLQESGVAIEELAFEHVEACLKLIEAGPPQGRVSLPRALEARREYGFVRVQEKPVWTANGGLYQYKLSLGDQLVIPESGVRMQSSVHRCRSTLRPKGEWEALFDIDRIAPMLTVRNFRVGDRIQPLGMSGRKKVKDLFIDLKVPARVRRQCPFLLSGAEILWIPGYARSDLAKIGPTTVKVLRVAVQPAVGRRA
jgi:tRNA(Ile)-lysidine synthase